MSGVAPSSPDRHSPLPDTHMHLTIREFEEPDRAALRLIYTAARRAAFTWREAACFQPQDFDADTRSECILVALADGVPVGFASIWERDSFLHNLFVHPDFQRKGVGTALLAHCSAYFTAARPTLKCLKANTRAIDFYTRQGWQAVADGDSPDGPYLLFARPAEGE